MDYHRVHALPQLRRLERKYGRYDFQRYEDILADASLAVKSLGQITVDCRFRSDRSQWGVLTKEKLPGGIIYLDLDFHQPGDDRLKDATVTVTLDDDSKDLTRHFPIPSDPEESQTSVHIGNYGPTQILGVPKSAHKSVEHQAAPQIDAGGFVGVGNMGRNSTKDYEQEYRWTFLGQKRPSKSNSSRYKVLTWTITENKLDPQSYHSNTIHTAFAFQHGGQPFFIQVAIQGRLQSKWSDVGRKFSSLKDKRFATMLVNFDGKRFTKVLDQVAQGLPHAMQKENLLKAPLEARDIEKPTYSETTPWSQPTGPNRSKSKTVPLQGNVSVVTDKETSKKKANKSDILREGAHRTLRDDDLAAAIISLSYFTEFSDRQSRPVQLKEHVQLANTYLDVVDKASVTGGQPVPMGGNPRTPHEKRDARELRSSPSDMPVSKKEADQLKFELSQLLRALRAEWKQLLQQGLQFIGVIALLTLVGRVVKIEIRL